MQARKKPVIVECVQLKMLSIRSYKQCKKFVGESWVEFQDTDNGLPAIKTLEGDMTVSDKDYIVKGVEGEFYPVKPDIFHKTYDTVLDKDELDSDQQQLLEDLKHVYSWQHSHAWDLAYYLVDRDTSMFEEDTIRLFDNLSDKKSLKVLGLFIEWVLKEEKEDEC